MYFCLLSVKSKGITSYWYKANSSVSCSHTYLGLVVSKGAQFDLIGYSYSDWAGDRADRKSTSGTCHFLGRSLVCWASKKKSCVSISTAEAEYIAAGSCCTQILWLKQTLKDYGIHMKKIPLLCDN